jgi:hypothetical protein
MNVINDEVLNGVRGDVKKLFDVLEELNLDTSEKQKSELISGLVENNVAKFVPNARAPKLDSEPDLYINQQPIEIKTTAGEQWRGGKYSKRPGYYVFVSWKMDAQHNADFFMAGTQMEESDWKMSKSKNYYATTYGKKELAANQDVEFFTGNLDVYMRGKKQCVRVNYR